MLQYVSTAVRVSDLVYNRATRQRRAMAESARWIGKFHGAHEARIYEPEFSFLKHYDAEYYRGWGRRTFEFAHPLRRRFSWLSKLREAGDEWFKPLLAARPTVIHGEFYAKTILIRNRSLFIVDWESAAIAAGEIDLAALTEGKHWPLEITRQCLREYLRSRWPDGEPPVFRTHWMPREFIYISAGWASDRTGPSAKRPSGATIIFGPPRNALAFRADMFGGVNRVFPPSQLSSTPHSPQGYGRVRCHHVDGFHRRVRPARLAAGKPVYLI